VYRSGGVWQFDNRSGGLNLTWCDDGTNTAECGLPSKYRRYFIFMTGFVDSDDESRIHQLAASEDVTYVSAGNCLDIASNPLTFTLPDLYDYTAVLLYAYCGRAADSVWTNNLINLRTQTSQAIVDTGIDTSVFLTKDGTRELTGNWDTGDFNITTKDIFVENLNATGNLTIGQKITFALGEIIENIVSGWLKITGNLWVTGDINASDINATGNVSITENLIVGKNTSIGGNLTVGGYFLNGSGDQEWVDASYLSNYSQIVTVDVSGNADFTTIQAAINYA
ncbi:unnamed protein product, partial [marine sediment metagenome]